MEELKADALFDRRWGNSQGNRGFNMVRSLSGVQLSRSPKTEGKYEICLLRDVGTDSVSRSKQTMTHFVAKRKRARKTATMSMPFPAPENGREGASGGRYRRED